MNVWMFLWITQAIFGYQIWKFRDRQVYTLNKKKITKKHSNMDCFLKVSFVIPRSLASVGSIRLTSDGMVRMSMPLHLHVECPFDFDHYPMDEQVSNSNCCIMIIHELDFSIMISVKKGVTN